jgi:general secretion pathway protein G
MSADPGERPSRGLARRDLLLAGVVLALLLGVAAPRLMQRQQHPEASVARVQLEALHKALQAYRMDVGHYPSDAQGLQALAQPPADADGARWRGPYYPDAPALDPWGSPYVYRFQGTVGRGYEVYSLGRDRAPGGQGEDADVGR